MRSRSAKLDCQDVSGTVAVAVNLTKVIKPMMKMVVVVALVVRRW